MEYRLLKLNNHSIESHPSHSAVLFFLHNYWLHWRKNKSFKEESIKEVWLKCMSDHEWHDITRYNLIKMKQNAKNKMKLLPRKLWIYSFKNMIINQKQNHIFSREKNYYSFKYEFKTALFMSNPFTFFCREK